MKRYSGTCWLGTVRSSAQEESLAGHDVRPSWRYSVSEINRDDPPVPRSPVRFGHEGNGTVRLAIPSHLLVGEAVLTPQCQRLLGAWMRTAG